MIFWSSWGGGTGAGIARRQTCVLFIQSPTPGHIVRGVTGSSGGEKLGLGQHWPHIASSSGLAHPPESRMTNRGGGHLPDPTMLRAEFGRVNPTPPKCLAPTAADRRRNPMELNLTHRRWFVAIPSQASSRGSRGSVQLPMAAASPFQFVNVKWFLRAAWSVEPPLHPQLGTVSDGLFVAAICETGLRPGTPPRPGHR